MLRNTWPLSLLNTRDRSRYPTPVASNRWRIYVDNNQGSGSWTSIREAEMKGSYGGADQCSGGTATASGTGAGNVPSRAFDNSAATMWQSGHAVPTWLEYQFAAPVFVYEVTITCDSSTNDAPKNFRIQYYDGANWITVRTFANVEWALVGQQRRFALYQDIPVADAREWRIRETKKQNSGSFCAWAELQFRSSVGGADLTSSGRAWASSTDLGSSPANAFDNNTGNRWVAANGTLGAYIANALSSGAEIVEVVATSSSTANDSVLAFAVEYFDGNKHNNGWRTHWGVETTNWSATQTRTFAKP